MWEVTGAFLSGIAAWSKSGMIEALFGKAFTEMEIAQQTYYIDNDPYKMQQSLAAAKRAVVSWIPGMPDRDRLGSQVI
jgi:hypothetical protein